VLPENKYLYNGKELNTDWDINLYEYGARWYDPAIGRFTGVDPIADQFPHLSVYNYASNDPIKNVDLHGLQGVPNYMVNDIKNRTENAVSGVIENVKSAPGRVGNWVYNFVVGNDDVSNVAAATEQASEGRAGDVVETVSKGAKVLGPVLDAAEATQIIIETDPSDPKSVEEGTQKAAKLGTEIGMGAAFGPAAGVATNLIIRNSQTEDGVTNLDNDKAANAYESSLNANKAFIEMMMGNNGADQKNNNCNEDKCSPNGG